MAENFYVTGGTLRADAVSYVERAADRDLLAALQGGEFCYVLTSRQMGKSSLMVRTAIRLREEGMAVAVLDLTAIGQNLTPEQWYGGLLRRLGRQLQPDGALEDALDDYWDDHGGRGPLQRFLGALEEVVLPFVLGGAPVAARQPPRLVLFLDEIDAVRSLPFSTDEFFAAIRELYNRRSTDRRFHALTFCLLGVATPSDLIRDTRMTPFNIGRRVELTDFTAAEAAPLAGGLAAEPGLAARLLDRVLYWTGGHPYLTQRLCRAVAEAGAAGPPAVDRACTDLFLSPAAREKDDNLIFVRERLLRSEADRATLLDLYAQVHGGRRVAADETGDAVAVLRLSGIVRAQSGRLLVRNRIYARAFDREWVTTHMPDAELRRQRAAFRRGFTRAAVGAGAMLAVFAALLWTAVDQARRADENASAVTAASQRAGMLSERRRQALEEREKAYQARLRALTQLQAALRDVREQKDRADRSAQAATTALGAAQTARAAALDEKRRAVLAQKRASDNARRAGLQEALARAATGRERQATLRALEALSQGQAERGVRLMQDGYQLGLLDLLEARRTAEPLPEGRASRSRLWAGWHQEAAGRLRTVVGHRFPLFAALYSPDGRQILTAALDSTARLWDAATGQQLGEPLEAPDGLTVQVEAGGPGMPVLAHRMWTFSPNGARIAAASAFEVFQWDARTHKLIGPRLAAPNCMALAYSADGQQLVALCRGGSLLGGLPPTGAPRGVHVRRFDVETGRPEGAVAFHEPGTNEPLISRLTGSLLGTPAVLSADGDYALIHAQDPRRQVRVWDTRTGRSWGLPLSEVQGNWGMAISADGRLAAIGSETSIRLWDVLAGQPRGVPLQVTAPNGLSFSPDGSRLAGGSLTGAVRVWRTDLGLPEGPTVHHQGFITSSAFHPQGGEILVASFDRTARSWYVGSIEPAGELVLPAAGPLQVRYTPRGAYLAAASPRGIQFWDGATHRPARLLEAPMSGEQIEFSADGRYVAARVSVTPQVNRAGVGLRVWEVATGRTVCTVPARGFSGRIALSGDGRVLIDLGFDGLCALWSVPEGRSLGEPFKTRNRLGAAFVEASDPGPVSLDGRTALREEADGRLRLLDLPSLQPRGAAIENGKVFGQARFSPDGRTLATATEGGARLWDAATGALLADLPGGGGTPMRLRFSPNGRYLAGTFAAGAGIFGGATMLWDLEKRVARAKFADMDDAGTGVLFSPDSRLGSLPSFDGFVRLFRTADGAVVAQIRLAGVGVAVGFSPDGALLLTETMDGAVQLWDTTTGQQFGPTHRLGFSAFTSDIGTGLALSPDGRRLLIQHASDRLRVLLLPQAPPTLREMELRTWTALGARVARDGGSNSIPFDEWGRLRGELRQVVQARGGAWEEPGPPRRTARIGGQVITIVRSDVPLEAKPIPLGRFYNTTLETPFHGGAEGNDLRDLRRGVALRRNAAGQVEAFPAQYAGVLFEIGAGVIQLGSPELRARGVTRPLSSGVIPIGRRARRLHFFHGAAFLVPEGTRVATVALTFADGQRWEIPVLYGRDVRDWWRATDPVETTPTPAWRGSSPASPTPDSLRLYRSTWAIPLPDVEIAAVEYVSAGTACAPFLVAITVD